MVTFLLTDVEGSTRLWEERPAEMASALADHDNRLAEIVSLHGGEMLKSRGEGDSTFSVFDDAAGAVAAAIDGQQTLAGGLLRVRMAIHTGHAEERDGDYFGPTVNRCARLRGAAHGGQIVLSFVARQLVIDRLPDGATLIDLGVHHLRDLAEPERVFQLCHPNLAAEFPPLASLDTRHHNLPPSLTTFIGRGVELATVQTALDDARLVTIVGPGGVGKTRLAQEAAAARVEDHRDGVWFVELSALTERGQVLAAVAGTLGVREEAGRAPDDTLAKALAEQDLLVVLDNCEHLIDAAASVAERILRAGPATRVLATSRQMLGITGERACPVAGLSTPDDAPFDTSEAIALFVDRATQVNPRFAMNAIDRDAAVEICRRLDGLPLAIELAAALADRMSVSDIANRLIERFELLTTGSRTAEPRQRSLTAAIDWSYELLEPAERDAFAALGVFPAGFDLRGAEAAVGRGAIETLGQLVAKSLVVHGEDRYSMLESIRVYAADRLAASGRVGQVHDRVVEWALALASEGDLDVIAREHENLLAALRWTMGRDPGNALRLTNDLGNFWEVRGFWTEGRRVLTDVLSRAGDADAAGRAEALGRGGRLAMMQGDLADAATLLGESLAMAEETDADKIVYSALAGLGAVAHMRGDVSEARVHFEASLGVARALGDAMPVAAALSHLGVITHATGELDQSGDFYAEALALARPLDNKHFLAGLLSNAGMLAEATGDLDRAAGLYGEAHELACAVGSVTDIASALVHLAQLHRLRGEFDEARLRFNESANMFRELGDRTNEANVLYRLGEMTLLQGDTDAARTMLERSLDLWREVGHALGEAAVLLTIGDLALQSGNRNLALQNFRPALQTMSELQSPDGVANALDGIAAAVATRPNFELAAELLGAADTIRARAGRPPASPNDRSIDPETVRQAIGDASYARARERGAGLSREQAVELGLAAAAAASGP